MLTMSVRVIWLATAAFVIFFVAQPVNTTVQLEMSVGAIVAMVVLWLLGKGRASHYVFLAIGSLVVWRYIYWRVFSTLPPASDWLNFIAGVTLLVAELYCFYVLFVSLVVSADPLNRQAPEPDADVNLPTVDVFVPSYNEDWSILAITLAAARSMSYPADKLTIWLLDDGGTDEKCADADRLKAKEAQARRAVLQKLCEDLGVQYLTRKANIFAKAGNLNYGLQNSSSEIVVVLDADHAPLKSFLRETIGYFAEDPRLYLVQTPHTFINPGPIEKNLKTFDKMPAESEMFYAVTQRGLDKWNACFFCGSAALLRREALEEAGGFSRITVTEDCETALDLHAQGWTSVYVEKPLIAGLQPDTLATFISQRSRWCEGMLQLLLLRSPLLRRGLRPIQRLCYLSNMTFWLFPIPRLIFVFAPLLYIFFDMKIVVANVQEACAYTLTYIIVNLMVQNYLYGRVRWPLLSELYEYVQGVFLIRVIGAIIMAPRKPRFVVTAKNVGHDSNQLSPMAFPYFVIYCLLFAAALVSGYKYYFTPGATNLMVVVGLWNFFNLLTAGAALGVVAERGKTEDMALPLEVERYGALRINGLAIDVRIESVSSEKCRIRMEALPPMRWEDDADKGMLSVLPIQGVGKGTASLSALPVRMTRIGHLEEEWICELTFERLSPRDYFALVDLMYADPDVMTRFVQRRRARKDLFSGCAQFIWWGLSEPFRAFSYLFAGAWSRPPAGKQRDPQAAQLTRLAPLHPNQFGSARDMTADTIARSPRPAWQADRRQNGDIPAAAAGTTPSWVELMTEAENDAVAQEHRKSSNGEARPDGGET